LGFDLWKHLQDRVGEVDGAVRQNIGGGLRMAGDALSGILTDVSKKGAIPIPLTNVIPEARTVAGYGKSLLGPAGMPLRVMDNPGSSQFYQQAINAADYDPERQVVIFNKDIENQAEYDRLGQNLSNKDFGQFVGQIQPDGSVIVDDDYDTNRSALWHWNRLTTGKDKEGRELHPLNRAISGASGLHKKLEQAGWTNPHPFGAPGSVEIGTYQR